MKKWIMMIFNINSDLDKQYEKLEEKIKKLSLNSGLPAEKLYEKIIELNKRKNDLINLRVLYNAMADLLEEKELELISRAAKKERYLNGVSENRRGIIGEINKVLARCERVAARAGFSNERFERTYPYFFAAKKQAV